MKWTQRIVISFVVWLFAGAATFFPVLGATSFDTNGLWLEMTMTNSVAQTNYIAWTNHNVVRTNMFVQLTYYATAFVIHSPASNTNGIYEDGVYDLYGGTNLSDPSGWTWLMRNLPGQTDLLVTNIPPEQGFYRLALPDAIRPGYDQQFLPANDDGSTDVVPIGFCMNFYGNSNTTLYVNNNGDVTFNSPQSDYTPKTLASLGIEVIAPFWADVDTRPPSPGVVTYGTNTVDGCASFGVDWVNVGYFQYHADNLLSCQLVIISRSDIAPGDFDMEFNYGKVQWQWGDANPAPTPPRAGFADNGVGYELPGSGTNYAFLDTSTTGLIYHSLNTSVPGRYLFRFRDGLPQF